MARTYMRGGLGLALALGTLLPAAGLAASGPPVGTFDQKGRYRPPQRRDLFRRQNRRAQPRPLLPVVLVHGQGGFDRIRLGPVFGDYFNGVARRLREDGIEVLVTKTSPFGSIAERAQQLKDQLLEAGYPQVNLVCHSMGGLDSRYMVTHLGMADRVASITTVATPHHGSWYADFVLEWVMEKQRFWKVWELLGLEKKSIPELTVRFLEEEFNPRTPDVEGIRYFSIGGSQSAAWVLLPFKGARIIMSLIEKRAAGKGWGLKDRILSRLVLPKALRERLAEDPAAIRASLGVRGDWVIPEEAGRNDCMVSTSSARWGEYLGTVDADHFDQPGWFGSFQAPRFFRGVAEMLADAGY